MDFHSEDTKYPKNLHPYLIGRETLHSVQYGI
jgi:hypothetical protein